MNNLSVQSWAVLLKQCQRRVQNKTDMLRNTLIPMDFDRPDIHFKGTIRKTMLIMHIATQYQ